MWGFSLCLGVYLYGGLFSGTSSRLGIKVVTLDSLGIGLFILPKLATPKLATLKLSGLFVNPNLVG